MPKRIWEIKLLIETDDDDVIESLVSSMSLAACPVPPTELAADHSCRHPWLVVRTELEGDEAEGWRDALNR